MQIKLNSLHIDNFKGIKVLDVTFGDKTQISGQNASGKTTIFDAFTWLLFNKNSAGEEKFNIRPLDENGNRVDNVEIKVVAVLDVDGKEVELCIDTWPWIPTFLEIEGPSEKVVWDTAKKLGLKKEKAKFGSVDTTYEHYYGVDPDIVNLHTPKILFDMDPPEWAKK